jgi:uroporphyrinogen decarboxylase
MRHELEGTGIALIGFAGAPWTLASYAIEGHSWKTGQHTKRFLYDHPEAFHTLMQTISTQLIDYLCMQVEAGAQVLQLFDTWGGVCPSPYYASCVDAYQRHVIEGVKAKHPEVPIILFVKHSRGLFPYLAASPADIISIDDLTPLSEARTLLPNKVLQGNLDSSTLFMNDAQRLVAMTENVLREGGDRSFIFNLGHGVLPQTPRENVALVVDTIKQWKYSQG